MSAKSTSQCESSFPLFVSFNTLFMAVCLAIETFSSWTDNERADCDRQSLQSLQLLSRDAESLIQGFVGTKSQSHTQGEEFLSLFCCQRVKESLNDTRVSHSFSFSSPQLVVRVIIHFGLSAFYYDYSVCKDLQCLLHERRREERIGRSE